MVGSSNNNEGFVFLNPEFNALIAVHKGAWDGGFKKIIVQKSVLNMECCEC